MNALDCVDLSCVQFTKKILQFRTRHLRAVQGGNYLN